MTLDPVAAWLVERGIRVTRKNCIASAYTEHTRELNAEGEAMVREALAHYRGAGWSSSGGCEGARGACTVWLNVDRY